MNRAAFDSLNPSHYRYGSIECIDFIEGLGMGREYCLGNAIKYLTRAGRKDSEAQDLEKAIWYIRRRIKQLQRGKKHANRH